MKNYISINGKQTELTDEQLKQLGMVVDNKPKWEDFGKIEGYYISSNLNSSIHYASGNSSVGGKNIFPTEAEAKACLALSQLCQWRDKYNSGWKSDWTDDSCKYVIYLERNKIKKGLMRFANLVLAFKSAEIRDKFLEDFSELIMEAAPLL